MTSDPGDAAPNAEPRARWSHAPWEVVVGSVLAFTAGVGLALALDAVVRVLSGSSRVPGLDADVLRWMVDHRSPTLTDWMRSFTTLGSFGVIAPLTVCVVIGLLVMRRFWAAGYLVVVVVGAGLVGAWAKSLIDRPRPPVALRLVTVSGSAFPSGHATQAAATYVALLVLVITLVRSRRWRIAAGIVLITIVVAVGVSRPYLGAHWATDVLAGWLVGTVWALGAAAAFRPLGAHGPTPARIAPAPADL